MATEHIEVMSSDEAPSLGLVDVSLDAAIELEEMAKKERDAAPSLMRVVALLKENDVKSEGGTVSMLSDVRGIAMVRRALPQDDANLETDRDAMRAFITKYLDRLVDETESRGILGIREAKRFCLALNRELLKRQHERLTSRRWRQESAA